MTLRYFSQQRPDHCGGMTLAMSLVCLCVLSHVVCDMQVPCPAILLSQAAYMAAVSSGMSMQRAK